jgi:hypothetical protein
LEYQQGREKLRITGVERRLALKGILNTEA